MPPSERATLRSGKRRRVGPNSRSWATRAAIWQVRTIRWSIGASGAFLIRSKPGADVQRQDHVLVAQRLEHGVPVAGQEAREVLGMRRLEEADRPAALLGDAMDLLHGQIDVPHRDDAERDEPARVGAAPLVDGPVVVRLEHHERDLLVMRLVEGAGVPARHGREAHRRQHAVDVHVPDPLVDVEAAGPQFGVGAGVEAPLLPGPSDGGGHAERRRRSLALEHPFVDAVVVADHLGGLVGATWPGRGSCTCPAARPCGRRY